MIYEIHIVNGVDAGQRHKFQSELVAMAFLTALFVRHPTTGYLDIEELNTRTETRGGPVFKTIKFKVPR